MSNKPYCYAERTIRGERLLKRFWRSRHWTPVKNTGWEKINPKTSDPVLKGGLAYFKENINGLDEIIIESQTQGETVDDEKTYYVSTGGNDMEVTAVSHKEAFELTLESLMIDGKTIGMTILSSKHGFNLHHPEDVRDTCLRVIKTIGYRQRADGKYELAGNC